MIFQLKFISPLSHPARRGFLSCRSYISWSLTWLSLPKENSSASGKDSHEKNRKVPLLMPEGFFVQEPR